MKYGYIFVVISEHEVKNKTIIGLKLCWLMITLLTEIKVKNKTIIGLKFKIQIDVVFCEEC